MTLAELKKKIESFRYAVLCDEVADSPGLDPIAEQQLLLCLNSLEAAQRYAALASIYQSRALAGRR